MLVACRLAGLSALERHYAGLNTLSQWRALRGRGEDYRSFEVGRDGALSPPNLSDGSHWAGARPAAEPALAAAEFLSTSWVHSSSQNSVFSCQSSLARKKPVQLQQAYGDVAPFDHPAPL
jgi:hypothetical protein